MRGVCHALALLALAGAPPAQAAADPPSPQAGGTVFVAAVLNVVDPETELAFYRQVFGLELATTLDHGLRREYILRFPASGTGPNLILLHDRTPDAGPTLERGTAFNRLVLRVSDMDAVIARLDGLRLVHPAAREAASGYRILQLTDPQGTNIEVVQPAARRSALP